MQADSKDGGQMIGRRVGFYVGGVDLNQGGVLPFANRVLDALVGNETDSSITLKTIREDTQVATTPQENAQSFPKLRLIGRRIKESFQVLTREGSVAERVKSRVPRPTDPRFESLDLLHVPFQTPPTYELPYICTMHDVQELHFPEYFSAQEREIRAIHYRKSLENAVRIVVSFDHVKSDLVRFFACPEDKVRVMPLPYGNCIFKPLDSTKLTETAVKYSGIGRFFLYPAQTWAHKNHLLLIEALERTQSKLDFPVSLVCTGKTNDYFKVIESRIKESKYANAIHFKGIVDEGELRWLYENCIGVVIPTRYEAGSFPLMEAMSMSSPVICSNVTSLPDTIDNADYLFDPQDPRKMSELMTRLATDAGFREANRNHGRNRIEQLKRADVAGSYFQLWNEVLEELRTK